MPHAPHFLPSPLRRFIESEAASGLVLIGSAVLAIALANSPGRSGYAALLGVHAGPFTLLEWINDAGMAVFFLLVGLEIKREVLHGQLRGWPARILPGLAAAFGMIGPALVYLAFNGGTPTARGWAVPAATDIAFALGVMALLGPRVPASLKIFLTALAVLDDLGAVAIIALAYSGHLAWPMLGLAALITAGLAALNRLGIRRLWPYLLLGVPLWLSIHASGVHATVAGVVLAMTVPARGDPGGQPPLQRLEIALSGLVAFVIMPLFGFANAGVAVSSAGIAAFTKPVTLGVALGLFAGKQVGVMLAAAGAVAFGIAQRPARSTWLQFYGVALLCGIGFTMSLFIGLLAFAQTPEFQDDTKLGVLMGSLLSAVAGALVLRLAPPVRRRDSHAAGVTDP